MSSRSLNKVTLIGNLTRDPELRYTPQGTAVCTFGLATNRSWTTDSGEKREETEFHRIVSWNKLAELCSQLLVKGRKVYLEGRLATRTWTGQDGMQHTSTEIVIEDMILLDSKRPVVPGEEVARLSDAAAVVGQPAGLAGNQPSSTSSSDQTAQPPADQPEEKETEEKKDINPADIPF